MESVNFKKIRSLGLGATAEVFEAINLKTTTSVALKVFNPIVLNDPDAMERLRSEVEVLSRLEHANIVRLLGQHHERDFYGLELELIRGCDLRHWNAGYKEKLLEPKLWILAQIAKGLGAAHEMEILHRDLKPENVLVSQTGEVKLTDFGLARQLDRLTITRLGLLTGSLGYMAPEIVSGGKPSAASDVFSFGVIAYELLVNEAPFQGETPQALLKSLLDAQEVPAHQKNPLVPVGISKLLGACLAKDPAARPGGIWEVEAEILKHLASTRLLPMGKVLVAPTTRGEKIAESLVKKNRSLRAQVEKLNKKFLDFDERKLLLSLASELQTLFPDDETLPLVFSLLEAKEIWWTRRRAGGLAAASLLLVVFLLFLGWTFWPRISAENSTISAANGALPESANLGIPFKLGSEGFAEVLTSSKKKPSVSPKTARLASTSARGKIKFITDDDVSIFVDDQPVPPDEWGGFEVSSGAKKIKMIKRGFMPLESTVTIEPFKTTVVSAKGDRGT